MTQFTLPLPVKEIESIVDAIETSDDSAELFIVREQFAFLILPPDTFFKGLLKEGEYTIEYIVNAIRPDSAIFADYIANTSTKTGLTKAYMFLRISFDRMPGRMRHLLVCDVCNNLLHPEEAHKQEFDEQDLWFIRQFDAVDDARKLAAFMNLLTSGSNTPVAEKIRTNMALMLEALDR